MIQTTDTTANTGLKTDVRTGMIDFTVEYANTTDLHLCEADIPQQPDRIQ